jgi:hypothetical protein
MTSGSSAGPLEREARIIKETLRAIDDAKLDARIALGLCEQAGGVEGYSKVDEAFRVLAEQLRRGLAAEALFRERGAELGGLVRVVDPHRVGVRSEVDDLVAPLAQRLEDLVAQVHTTVVERHGDFHATDRT